ncbi:MAG: carboxynorspermidine decarboxylase [Verrucomicrobiota bacterium]
MSSAAFGNLLDGLDLESVDAPSYVIDLEKLRANGRLLAEVQGRSGCKILLALKAFAVWRTFPEFSEFLAGTCSSGIHEARLARDEFGKEVHFYSPGLKESEIPEVLQLADHVVFNSMSQYHRFAHSFQNSQRSIQLGLRINPECPVSKFEQYDPSAPKCRFGVRANEIGNQLPPGIEGLHFHNLCEQGVGPLRETLNAVETKFGHLIQQAKWINFGGGHYITDPGYDINGLVDLIVDFQRRYDLRVYLEPGEAIALDAGVLVATVLDVIERGDESAAILDFSPTNHMPDVLEMPYTPDLVGSLPLESAPFKYELGSASCLSCDIIGTYGFDQALHVGQKLVFLDQAVYTMVKTSNFNGLKMPDIATYDSRTGVFQKILSLGYKDYRDRLSSSHLDDLLPGSFDKPLLSESEMNQLTCSESHTHSEECFSGVSE